MTESDLLVPHVTFFTTDGADVWVLESHFTMPSCTLRNMRTLQKETFGMGGLTAQRFKRIIMPGTDGVSR